MNTFKYFLYLRKSTDREDVQALSIDGQRTSCESFAANNGFLIVDSFVEHRTAKVPGRPVFTEMLRRIEKGDADGIISYHPNRLARNSKDGGELIYWLDTGKLKDLKFPSFWFQNDPQGKSMLGIEFAQSKRYSDDLAIVTKRGLHQKCLRGEFPGKGPRGYLNDRKTRLIHPDPEIAPLIAKMFERFAGGFETIQGLRLFLWEQGLISRRTKQFPGGSPLDATVLRSMLSNPIYYGAFRFDGVIYDGKHTPLISKSLFDKVQDILTIRRPFKRQIGTPKPFTKLIKCGECGMSITTEVKKGYVYYRCSKKSRFVDCHSPFIREEALEKQLTALLKRHTLPSSVLHELSQRFEDEAKIDRFAHAKLREDKLTRQRQVAEQLTILTDTYLNREIDRELYIRKQNELQSERGTLRAEIRSMEQGRSYWLEPVKNWLKTAQQVDKIVLGGSAHEKRGLAVEIFGSNLRLDGKILRGRAVKPWDASLDFTPESGLVPLHTAVRNAFQRSTIGDGPPSGAVGQPAEAPVKDDGHPPKS